MPGQRNAHHFGESGLISEGRTLAGAASSSSESSEEEEEPEEAFPFVAGFPLRAFAAGAGALTAGVAFFFAAVSSSLLSDDDELESSSDFLPQPILPSLSER